jgi:cytochrome b
MRRTVRVWDLPTRVFHWLLAAGVVGLLVTGRVGGALMQWHARLGYAVLALLLFRVVWGFVGGHWSRFAAFVAGPARILAYVRAGAHADARLGHNPLGALSVLAMMALLLVQVATGLVGDDEIAFTGPLNPWVTRAQGLAATWYHRHIGQWAILALVGLHVAAVLFHLWRCGENLVGPMLHGDKSVGGPARASRDDVRSRAAAAALLLACAAAVTWLVRLGG